MTKKTAQKIDTIIENFDFRKVRRVMVFMGWKWAGEEGEKTPTIAQLKARARQCLEKATERCVTGSSCGGFHARRHEPNQDGDTLELAFQIERGEA